MGNDPRGEERPAGAVPPSSWSGATNCPSHGRMSLIPSSPHPFPLLWMPDAGSRALTQLDVRARARAPRLSTEAFAASVKSAQSAAGLYAPILEEGRSPLPGRQRFLAPLGMTCSPRNDTPRAE